MSGAPASGLRWVVLHHVGHGREHFDLMIEREPGGMLRTWRLFDWPPHDTEPECEPLADHRRHYLDHEGSVSGGRGSVRRVDQGDDATVVVEGDRVTLSLDGRTLRAPLK